MSGQMQGGLKIEKSHNGQLLLTLAGSWRLTENLQHLLKVQNEIDSCPEITGIAFYGTELQGWDSSLLTFLMAVIDYCSKHGIAVNRESLPPGVNHLLSLACAVPEQKGMNKDVRRKYFLERAGESAISLWHTVQVILAFIGETFIALLRLFTGKSRFRGSDLIIVIQECSAEALPIVSLISLLVGLILAFVGSIQLKLFGAQIFVADLVGIGMVRAMGAIMTGIIMAGRTGASFAATIGSMKVNEEIDALQTTGISPIRRCMALSRPRSISITMSRCRAHGTACRILLYDRITRKRKKDFNATNAENELERLRAFYNEIAELTISHEVINDTACVTARRLCEALERVDRNWLRRYRVNMALAEITLENPGLPVSVTLTIKALMDLDSVYLIIPESLRNRLQLEEIDKREVILEDGERKLVPYVGPVLMRFKNRLAFAGAIVTGDQVVVGYIPMEDMDLIIDPVIKLLN